MKPLASAWKAALWLVLGLMTGAVGLAQDLQSAHFKVLRLEKDLKVHPDGSQEWELSLERLALSEAGAVTIGKYVQGYIESIESLEIKRAYTLKADGRRFEVKPEDVLRQSGLAAAGAGVSWPDMALLQITWPQLQKADRAVLVLKGRSRKPLLPGWIAGHEVIASNVDMDQVRLRLEVPQAMAFQVQGRGMSVRSHASGQNKVWELSGSFRAKFMDVGAVNVNSTLPFWSYSSLGSWEQLGQAFMAGFQARRVVNPRLQALAEQVTQGESTALGKARKIHQWMRQNIRYVAVFLGVGGWEPHDLEWILDNRYGDCKDQSLLMVALLEVVGVQAAPVLLRAAQPDHELPELAVPWFDHCIVFISELGLFVDPSAVQVPWGDLPLADRDKPALIADVEGRSRLQRTPPLKASDNRLELSSAWQVQTDGSASAKIKVRASGHFAVWLQGRLRQVGPELRGVTLARWLQAVGMAGEGDMAFPPIDVDSGVQELTMTFRTRPLLLNPEAGALSLQPLPSGLGLSILANLGNVRADKREYALMCVPMSLHEEFELRFAQPFNLLHVPASARHANPALGLQFDQTVKTSGNLVTGTRQFSQSHARHTCTPEQHQARWPTLNQVWRRLNGSLLFTSPGQ